MPHVLLHDKIDTPLHKPTHIQLLEHTPPDNIGATTCYMSDISHCPPALAGKDLFGERNEVFNVHRMK